jgi:hypothetical protein
MDDVAKYLKALVFLQVNQQTGGGVGKPEILLYRAGFKPKEIAEMLGKKEAAVAKAISRAKTDSD